MTTEAMERLIEAVVDVFEAGREHAKADNPEAYEALQPHVRAGCSAQLIVTLLDDGTVSVRGALANDFLQPVVQIFEFRARAVRRPDAA